MITLWFNQCFSTIYYTIQQYKNMYGNSIKIIGTSSNPEHVFKVACDEFYVEPSDYDKEWALNFCAEHKVDIFFVKKNRIKLSKYKEEFERAGVKIVTDDYTTHKLFDSKAEAYNEMNMRCKNLNIPEFKVAKTISEFKALVNNPWTENKLCYKLDSDEGGGSFRVISDKRKKHGMELAPTFAVTSNQAIEQAEQAEKNKEFKPIIVMELLSSPEISVDCYNSKQGFVCTTRKKQGGRLQRIESIKEIEDTCREIQKAFKFKFPWNIQFMSDPETGKPMILEINTRLSGGSHLGILSNSWIGEYLIKDLLNEDYKLSKPKSITVGKIEGHLVLQGE